MMSATNGTQFTRTLMLFVGSPRFYNACLLQYSLGAFISMQSQTQHGSRYQPNLTRFYAQCTPLQLLECITNVVIRFELKYKVKPDNLLIKIGGYDRRKEKFIGVINVEYFAWEGGEGSRCVMNRTTVSSICLSPEISPDASGVLVC